MDDGVFLGVGFSSRPPLFNLIAIDIFQGKNPEESWCSERRNSGMEGSFGALSARVIYDYTASYD